jgi:DNA-binding MarR family transcriptional regulator
VKQSTEMLRQCACNRIRTVARLVTKSYDDLLRPTGLKSSQLAVLAAVDSLDAPSIAALSKALFMDRTTLSRNLRPLVSARLVELREDGRRKTIRMTAKGRNAIAAAFPIWRKAQEAMLRRVDDDLFDKMARLLPSLPR